MHRFTGTSWVQVNALRADQTSCRAAGAISGEALNTPLQNCEKEGVVTTLGEILSAESQGSRLTVVALLRHFA